MENGTINIKLRSGFDARGISDAGRGIDAFHRKLLATNKSLQEVNADLSRRIHNVAALMANDLGAAADKEIVTKHALSAKEIEAAWRKAYHGVSQASKTAANGMAKLPGEAAKAGGKLDAVFSGVVNGIGGKFKSLATMLMQGGIWGAMGALATKAISGIWNYFEERAKQAAEYAQYRFDKSLESFGRMGKAVGDALSESISTIDKAKSRIDSMTESFKKATKAQVELAKQMAIANGVDPKTANALATDLSTRADFNAEGKRLRDTISLELKGVAAAEEAEKKAARIRKRAEANAESASRKYINLRKKYVDEHWTDYEKNGVSRAEFAFDQTEEGKSLRKQLDDARKEATDGEGAKAERAAKAAAEKGRAAIAVARSDLRALSTQVKAYDLQMANEAKAKAEEEAKKNAEERKKEADERKKEDEKEAQEIRKFNAEKARLEKEIAAERKALEREVAAERERRESELHKRRMDDLREEIAAQKESATPLRTVAAAAQSEFDRAFAMYRDPSRAAAEIGEEKDYQNDLDRLHRDARGYGGKWRIDELSRLMSAGDTQGVTDTLKEWRRSKGFTPEIEAMVRASAAEKTKTTAEDELRKVNDKVASMSDVLKQMADSQSGKLGTIADSTSGLAAKVDQLLKVKG